MKKTVLLFVILFSVFLNAEENIQDSLKTKRKVYQLEGITVIADKPEQSIGNICLKSYNPTESILEIDAAEALEDFSGIDLSIGGKGGSELSIRGFNEEQIKIMIDGRPLSNSYMDAVDLTGIPLTNIKEIQVLKGPISALYGSNTMGGVVNIITKSPLRNKQLTLGTQIRRNNTNKYYANLYQKFDTFDYSISASRYHTDGFVLSDDFHPTTFEFGSVRDRNASTIYDFQTKFNLELFDFHKIGLQFGYTNQPLKEIVSDIYEPNFREFTDWKRYQASLSAFFQLTDFLEYNGQIYYDQYNDTYVEYKDADFSELDYGWPSDLESWTFGTHNFVDWNINKNLKLTNGLRYEKSAYNRKDNQSYIEWTSNSSQQLNYFLQAEAKQNDFSITISSGFSFFKIGNSNEWKAHFQPSAGIYFKNNNNLKLSLASGINTTYPSLRQLFSSHTGNEHLHEEKAWKNEFTIEQPFAFYPLSGNIYSSIYYNKITDLIQRIGDINQNLKEAESYGFESVLKLKFGWEHEISYSYLKYTDKDIARLVGAPEHNFSFKQSYKVWKNCKIIYQAVWKDTRLTENPNIVLESYWNQSIKLQTKFKRYKLAFGLDNIFDTNYFSKYGYPAPGRNFIINLEVEI
jgi:iron complex outermembrane receptor protein/outer membrane receptor for ferrienterochelin and colicins